MKTIFFVVVALCLFTSCQKKSCHVCTMEMTTYGPGIKTEISSSQTLVCDKTNKQIEGLENAGTITSKSRVGNKEVTVSQRTDCN